MEGLAESAEDDGAEGALGELIVCVHTLLTIEIILTTGACCHEMSRN
jgi:hypothetical protein